MRLILTRHGQVKENLEKTFPRPTSPLDSTGLKQALGLAARLREHPIDMIYHSPYTRAEQTAGFVALNHRTDFEPGENYFSDERLVDFLKSERDQHLSRFYDFFREITKKHSQDSVLVVSHETPMMVLTCLALGKSIEEHFDNIPRPYNTALSEFITHPYGETIVMNCTKHLE